MLFLDIRKGLYYSRKLSRGQDMVYTLTVNPSLDYAVTLEKLESGCVNRAESAVIRVGGKGINVSTVLTSLGVKTVALGFIAGWTGTHIEVELGARGIHTDFVHSESGLSRINVKIAEKSAWNETEINASGPLISQKEVELLLEKLAVLGSGDTLVLAGTVPPSLGTTFYATVMSALTGRGVRFVVDTSGSLLESALTQKPFLVKPNVSELETFFGKKICGTEEIAIYAKKMQEAGAQNVLVSLGKSGALLVDGAQNVFFQEAPAGICKSAVGSGDSLVAGFLAACEKGLSFREALLWGVCAGSASAFCEGLCTKTDFFALLQNMRTSSLPA